MLYQRTSSATCYIAVSSALIWCVKMKDTYRSTVYVNQDLWSAFCSLGRCSRLANGTAAYYAAIHCPCWTIGPAMQHADIPLPQSAHSRLILREGQFGLSIQYVSNLLMKVQWTEWAVQWIDDLWLWVVMVQYFATISLDQDQCRLNIGHNMLSPFLGSDSATVCETDWSDDMYMY